MASTFPACSHPTLQEFALPSRNTKCLKQTELCPATAHTVLTHSSALSALSIRRVACHSSRIASCHLYLRSSLFNTRLSYCVCLHSHHPLHNTWFSFPFYKHLFSPLDYEPFENRKIFLFVNIYC